MNLLNSLSVKFAGVNRSNNYNESKNSTTLDLDLDFALALQRVSERVLRMFIIERSINHYV